MKRGFHRWKLDSSDRILTAAVCAVWELSHIANHCVGETPAGFRGVVFPATKHFWDR
jgi:hypothetical protein